MLVKKFGILLWWGILTVVGAGEVPRFLLIPPTGGQSVLVQNFCRRNSTQAAIEKSLVEAYYDAQNLYFKVKAQDFALDPVSNQTHLFKAKLRGNQGPIWEDDSVEFRIQNPNDPDKKIFYAGFNSNAAYRQLWLSSGKSPQHKSKVPLKVTAGRQRGYWHCEVAIPWKSLGIVPIPGNWFKLKITRFRQTGPETSDWPAKGYAIIRLGEAEQPTIREHEISPAGIKTGKIPLQLVSSRQVTAQSNWRTAGAWRSSAHQLAIKSGENSLIMADLPTQPGRYFYELHGPAGELWYRSGLIDLETPPPELTLQVTTDKPVSVLINGQIWLKNVGSGRYACFLPQEVNSLKLEAPSGTKLTTGLYCGSQLLSRTWRPGEVKMVLNRVSNIHPKHQNDVWHISRNGALLVYLSPVKPAGSTLTMARNLTWTVQLPPGLELVAVDNKRRPVNCCSAAQNWFLSGAVYQANRRSATSRGTTWTIRRNCAYALPKNSNISFFNSNQAAFLMLQANSKAQSGRVTVQLKMNDDEVVELPRHFRVKILPELAGVQPKKFHLTMLTGSLFGNEDFLAPHLATLRRAGINQLSCYWARTKLPLNYGMGMQGMFSMTCYPYLPTHLNLTELYARYPQAKSTKFDGKPMDTPDLAFLNRTPGVRPFLKKELLALRQRLPALTALFWDYESPAIPNNIDWCTYPLFSQYAMKYFAAEFKITESLTPELIARKYRREWIKFNCAEVAKAVRLITSIANEAGLQLVLYSGYHSEDTKKLYTIDWNLIGSGIDYAYCGYGVNPTAIVATRRAIAPRPLCGGILTNNTTRDQELRHSVAEIVRMAVECQGGILFWYANIWDHLDLQNIAIASQVIARHESFFTQGVRTPGAVRVLTGRPEAVYNLQLGAEHLVVLINESPKQEHFELLTATGAKYSGTVPAGAVATWRYHHKENKK